MRQKKITSWSASRYSAYKQCPFKAKLKFIDNLKEPANEAMERGSAIHDIAENYIKGKGRNLPKELNQFPHIFKMLRKQYKKSINGMVVEDTWAFDKNWEETQWNNWKDCRVRIKLDCAYQPVENGMTIIDWKTGKYRPDNRDDYVEQLELYALAALLLHPHIDTVAPQLAYLDYGIIYPDANESKVLLFDRSDIPKLKKLWSKRTKKMLNDTIFAPTPNMFCYNCHFRKANGGQCEY